MSDAVSSDLVPLIYISLHIRMEVCAAWKKTVQSAVNTGADCPFSCLILLFCLKLLVVELNLCVQQDVDHTELLLSSCCRNQWGCCIDHHLHDELYCLLRLRRQFEPSDACNRPCPWMSEGC